MRSLFYLLARILGDLNAIIRGPDAIARRLVRKLLWRRAGSAINAITRRDGP